MSSRRSFRLMIAGLARLPAVQINGEDHTGQELALLVAVDANQPIEEGARTSQLISEVGRLTARAWREKEMAEVDYRQWRDDQIFTYTQDVDEAEAAGFKSAVNPDWTGTGAKRVQKEPSCPSVADVNVYLRTLPKYRELYRTKIAAEEAWQTAHAAFEAAKARSWTIRGFEVSGGGTAPSRGYSDPDRGGETLAEKEAEYLATQAGDPPPSPPPGPTSSPPPPPSASPAPPPPPPRRD